MLVSVTVQVEIGPQASLDEVEAALVEAGREGMRRGLRAAIAERERRGRGCPHCRSSQARHAGTAWRLLLTGFGAVRVPLSRKQCRGCGRHYRPAGRLLAGLGGANVTGALRARCVEAGIAWPFATAARKVREWTGARVSAETVRTLTEAAGRATAAEQQAAASALVAPSRRQVARAPRRAGRREGDPTLLVVKLDGGWIGSREQRGGMEGKLAVLSTGALRQGQARRRLAPRRYAATFGTGEQVGELAYAAARAIGGERAAAQVALGDGASWIKTAAALHFPQATAILDWSHLARAMQRAVRAACPGRGQRPRRRQAYQAVYAALWAGQVDQARAALGALRPPGGEPVEALEEALLYLANQRGWIGDYAAWRAAGYPVGSGAVEREVELVINRRMKGQGMRWCRANAEGVVALRADTINADWDAESQRLAG